MVLSDNKTNTEILYLYFEKFRWTEHENKEQFNGHIQPKRVYRAVLNKDTGGYRVIYGNIGKNPLALILNSINNENEEEGFVCKGDTLDRWSIIKYDISEEDIDTMVGWIENDNADLKSILQNDNPTKTVDEFESPAMSDLVDIAELISTMVELKKINPLLFDSIFDFIVHVIESQPKDTSIDTTWLTMSKKFGTGANIYKALEHISTYAGEDKRTNLDEIDLFDAIKFLLDEYTNRNFNS